jgi:hypothetical protein
MANSLMEVQAAELKISEMGQNGAILLNNTTSTVTGKFRRIYAITNASFATLTSDITKNDATTPAVGSDFGTVPAGVSLYGKFTSVKLAGGSVLLMK